MPARDAVTFMHLANHGSRNIGNAALIHGLERVLREDMGNSVSFLPEPWDLYSRGLKAFDKSFVDRVNRDCDALLVGAAVAFDGSGGYANTGFRFDLPLELWRRIERPIILYGLSHRAWARRTYHHREQLARTLDETLQSNRVFFSVRNDGTKPWLEELVGTSLPQVAVVPDPAVFVPVEDHPHPELDPTRPNVLVAPNGEDEIERFGTAPRKRSLRAPTMGRLVPVSSSWRWREERERYLRALAGALNRIIADNDANLVFCANDPFDIGMAYDIFELLDADVRYRSSFASAALPVNAGPFFYDLYAKADLVIGMRIHSMTPAVGLGTPVVPVVSQDRMRAFMADAELSDLCVEMLDPDVGERLHEAADAALKSPATARARLGATVERLRERTAEVDASLATLVRSCAR